MTPYNKTTQAVQLYSLRRLSDMPGNQIAVACLGNDIDIGSNNDNPSLVSFRTNGRRPKGLKSTYVRNLKYGFRDPLTNTNQSRPARH